MYEIKNEEIIPACGFVTQLVTSPSYIVCGRHGFESRRSLKVLFLYFASTVTHLREGLNGAIAYTANGKNFRYFTANG